MIFYTQRFPTHQLAWLDRPHRQITWKFEAPPTNYSRQKCKDFGQEVVSQTPCSKKHEELWRFLDKKGILYYPHSGSELGVVRGSSYLSSDGDIDFFVDMPQGLCVSLCVSVPLIFSSKISFIWGLLSSFLPPWRQIKLTFSRRFSAYNSLHSNFWEKNPTYEQNGNF